MLVLFNIALPRPLYFSYQLLWLGLIWAFQHQFIQVDTCNHLQRCKETNNINPLVLKLDFNVSVFHQKMSASVHFFSFVKVFSSTLFLASSKSSPVISRLFAAPREVIIYGVPWTMLGNFKNKKIMIFFSFFENNFDNHTFFMCKKC